MSREDGMINFRFEIGNGGDAKLYEFVKMYVGPLYVGLEYMHLEPGESYTIEFQANGRTVSPDDEVVLTTEDREQGIIFEEAIGNILSMPEGEVEEEPERKVAGAPREIREEVEELTEQEISEEQWDKLEEEYEELSGEKQEKKKILERLKEEYEKLKSADRGEPQEVEAAEPPSAERPAEARPSEAEEEPSSQPPEAERPPVEEPEAGEEAGGTEEERPQEGPEAEERPTETEENAEETAAGQPEGPEQPSEAEEAEEPSETLSEEEHPAEEQAAEPKETTEEQEPSVEHPAEERQPERPPEGETGEEREEAGEEEEQPQESEAEEEEGGVEPVEETEETPDTVEKPEEPLEPPEPEESGEASGTAGEAAEQEEPAAEETETVQETEPIQAEGRQPEPAGEAESEVERKVREFEEKEREEAGAEPEGENMLKSVVDHIFGKSKKEETEEPEEEVEEPEGSEGAEEAEEPEEEQEPEELPPSMQVERVSTGVMGLDEKMQGGFVQGTMNLVTGKTGTGKTAFCANFLKGGADKGEPGVYVTTEERQEDIRADIEAMFGWSFEDLEEQGLVKILSIKPIFPSKEIDNLNRLVRSYISNLLDQVMEAVEEIGAERVIIDSVSIIEMFIRDEYMARVALASLLNKLREADVTALLTGTVPETSEGLSGGGIIEFLVDTVILLEFVPVAEDHKRTLAIRKMRRTDHDVEIFPFDITPEGIKIFDVSGAPTG